MNHRCLQAACAALALCLAQTVGIANAAQPPDLRSGSEIYQRFRDNLAQPECEPDASTRWRKHFANAPRDMANEERDVMPLFGYVVDSLIESDLPTELALIPFVESGYRPGAKSASGPAGLWQMIGVTARKFGIPIRDGYDGRLSPVDSTKAAVRYLKTLHGMFAGDWRLAAMAYNAGENRILSALRRSGQQARSVNLDTLTGVPDITRAYVRKLHALACVLDEAGDRAQWRAAINRPVPLLTDISVPAGVRLESWAAREGLDVEALRRMNPAFGNAPVGSGRKVLAAGRSRTRAERALWPEGEIVFSVPARTKAAQAGQVQAAQVHVVQTGESMATISRRYRIPIMRLMQRNDLRPTTVLQPGMRLKVD